MAFLATALAVTLALPAYTNHAGHIVRGRPVAVTNGVATLTRDGTNVWTVSLAAFPPSERARLRAAVGVRPPPATAGLRRAAFVREMRLRREALRRRGEEK